MVMCCLCDTSERWKESRGLSQYKISVCRNDAVARGSVAAGVAAGRYKPWEANFCLVLRTAAALQSAEVLGAFGGKSALAKPTFI